MHHISSASTQTATASKLRATGRRLDVDKLINSVKAAFVRPSVRPSVRQARNASIGRGRRLEFRTYTLCLFIDYSSGFEVWSLRNPHSRNFFVSFNFISFFITNQVKNCQSKNHTSTCFKIRNNIKRTWNQQIYFNWLCTRVCMIFDLIDLFDWNPFWLIKSNHFLTIDCIYLWKNCIIS